MEALFTVELTGPELEALLAVSVDKEDQTCWWLDHTLREAMVTAHQKLEAGLTIVESAGGC